jgi:hypothetical protein
MASEAINPADVIPNQGISMCDKKGNSIVRAQQVPVEPVAEFMMTAGRELAAFYEAVFRRYGPKEAKMAAQNWIEEFETMGWSGDRALSH